MIARTISYLRHNALALAAVFLALGGTAWAATKIGSNDIRRNAVESRHIGKGQVGTADLGAKSVGTGQLRAVPRAELIANGSQSFSNVNEFVEFDSVPVRRGLRLLTAAGDSVVVNKPGVYEVSGEVHWEADPDGSRSLNLRIDPAVGDSRSPTTDVSSADPLTNTTNAIATTVELGRGDIISLEANQLSGGGEVSLADINGFSARLAIQYLSPPGGAN